MSPRRTLRFAVVASLLAILFGFVTIGHARTHAADKTAEAACTFCQHATSVAVAPVRIEAHETFLSTTEVPDSTLLSASTVRAHGNRGPPRAA